MGGHESRVYLTLAASECALYSAQIVTSPLADFFTHEETLILPSICLI